MGINTRRVARRSTSRHECIMKPIVAKKLEFPDIIHYESPNAAQISKKARFSFLILHNARIVPL